MAASMAIKPATAHPSWRRRKKYPEWYRSFAITAEALNTITKPIKTSSKVTTKSQRSTLIRLAMQTYFTTEARRYGRRNLGRQHVGVDCLGSCRLTATNQI